MQFSRKNGAIPDHWYDNEVAMKKDPDDCYSKEFVERMAKHQQQLKAAQALRKTTKSS